MSFPDNLDIKKPDSISFINDQAIINTIIKHINIMSKVKVAKFLDGNLIMDTRNPEISQIRVVQTKRTVDNQGWVRRDNRSALIKDKREFLEEEYKEGQILPGTIYHVETTKEPYEGYTPKINPTTGEELTTADGELIYRQSFYSENPNMQDELIQHVPTSADSSDTQQAEHATISEEEVVAEA